MSKSPLSKGALIRTVAVRVLAAFALLAAMFFVPAGTLAYWEAWAYLAILFILMLLVMIYLLKNDPDLLGRRMRMGELVMYIFTPLALGSYWAIIPALFIIPILVARIRNEEKVLLEELKGYREYRQQTRYRLVPGIW